MGDVGGQGSSRTENGADDPQIHTMIRPAEGYAGSYGADHGACGNDPKRVDDLHHS